MATLIDRPLDVKQDLRLEHVEIDYLVCGSCQRNFPLGNILSFMQHKKFDCDDSALLTGGLGRSLLCKSCPQRFSAPWSLLQHAQNVHALQIYLETNKYSVGVTPATGMGRVSQNNLPQIILQSSIVNSGVRNLSQSFLATPIRTKQDGITNISPSLNVSGVTQLRTSPDSAMKLVPVYNNQIQVAGSQVDQSPKTQGMANMTNADERIPTPKSHSIPQVALTTESSQIKPSSTIEFHGKVLHQGYKSSLVVDHQTKEIPTQSSKIPNHSLAASSESDQNIEEMGTPTKEESVHSLSENCMNEDGSTLQIQEEVVVQTSQNSIDSPCAFQYTSNSATSEPPCDTHENQDNEKVCPDLDNTQMSSSKDNTDKPIGDKQTETISKEDKSVVNLGTKVVTKDVKGKDKVEEKGERSQEEEGDDVCCDNKECGITLMPVTHEEPKKCCIAVVPKKRKRHMQTKHMPFRRKRKRVPSNAERYWERESNTSQTLYIDIQPDSSSGPKGESTGESSHDNQTTSIIIGQDRPESMSKMSNITQEGSFLIQPGTSFSIPVPYGHRPSVTAGSIAFSSTTSPARQFSHGFTPESGQSPEIKREEDNLDPNTDGSISADSSMEHSQESGTTAFRPVLGGVKTEILDPSSKKRKYPTSRPFKCKQCNEAFNQRIHLKKHQSKHTGVKPFQCGQCSYSTVEKSHLKVHIRVHTGEKPFKCDYCEYATAQNSTLKIHLKRHHNSNHGNQQVFKCSRCGEQFPQETSLLDHTQQHSQQGGAAS